MGVARRAQGNVLCQCGPQYAAFPLVGNPSYFFWIYGQNTILVSISLSSCIQGVDVIYLDNNPRGHTTKLV